jgi:hypothetical protein
VPGKNYSVGDSFTCVTVLTSNVNLMDAATPMPILNSVLALI